MVMKADYLIIHHSKVAKKLYQYYAINQYHRDVKKFPKSSLGMHIGYHFIIEKNGRVMRARKDNETGAHTLKGWNERSIGVCVTGDFDIELPTEAQIKALQGLIKDYGLPYLLHQEADNRRTCAGKNLTRELIDSLPEDYALQVKARNIANRFSFVSYNFILKLLKSMR